MLRGHDAFRNSEQKLDIARIILVVIWDRVIDSYLGFQGFDRHEIVITVCITGLFFCPYLLCTSHK